MPRLSSALCLRPVHTLHRIKSEAFEVDLKAGRVCPAQHAIFRRQKLNQATLDLDKYYQVCEDKYTREERATMKRALCRLATGRGSLDASTEAGTEFEVETNPFDRIVEARLAPGHSPDLCDQEDIYGTERPCKEEIDVLLPPQDEMHVYSATGTDGETSRAGWEVLDHMVSHTVLFVPKSN